MGQYGELSKAGVVLTTRQVQILVLIANGQSTKEIADTLGISSKTVACHRSNIMHLLGIREVAGLVRYAVRSGLVEP
jgi:DNA-binding NarL/FixJ family response regulator